MQNNFQYLQTLTNVKLMTETINITIPTQRNVK